MHLKFCLQGWPIRVFLAWLSFPKFGGRTARLRRSLLISVGMAPRLLDGFVSVSRISSVLHQMDKDVLMLKMKYLFGLTLFIPLLGSAIPAEASAARAECFEKAQAAVAALGPAAQTAEKNATGADTYRACCKKSNIKP
jgi:hypothetical protein